MKDIKFNPQQAEAISHQEGPMIVLSVAGSGKTMVLTERIIHLIENGIDHARLRAITFAKKALLEDSMPSGEETERERRQGSGLHLPFSGLSDSESRELLDSSRVMVELVKLLSQPHRNVWLAADDDQSIHGFRGAWSEIFVSFGKECDASAKTIIMSHNYRSTGKIIRAANNLISHNRIRAAEEMMIDNGEGEEIETLEGDNEIAKADAIAKKILELTDKGYRFDDIAILARIYKLMPLIEVALIRHGIPCNSLDGLMYDRQDMKTLMTVMKFLLGKGSQGSIDMDLLKSVKADLSMQDKTSSLEDAFDIASSYALSGPKVVFLDEEAFVLRRFYLNSTGDLLHQYDTLSEFLDHVEEARRTNAHSPTGRVNLMTIHQAKGLEFKCVIVPGLNEGILPHVNSIEQVIMHIEEERRLMYVAMTRAMERLIITYRRRQTGKLITVASRFLKEITAIAP